MNHVTRICFLGLVLIFCMEGHTSVSVSYSVAEKFPVNPSPILTPGSLCERASSYRYKERIRYCERSVGTALKEAVVIAYNKQFGYQMDVKRRTHFKIDHLIPLCMGGSNLGNNLWPQHESVGRYTDPIEAVLCEKMRDGRVLQRQAIQLLLAAKRDLTQAEGIYIRARSL